MGEAVEAPRTATASVLFTDVVASTELRARRGEEAADALRRDLDALVRRIVEQRHGRIVKGLGDGVLAMFDAAVDAVAAGVALQQQAESARRRDPEGSAELRVGLSSGDVSIEDGDVFGTPVVEAARLCAVAQPGQVLVADIVRSLSRGRGAFVFESVGELALKGLPEPVAAFAVPWEPVEEPAAPAAPVPLPGLLAAGTATAYVGRTQQFSRITSLWEQIADGSRGWAAALLSGEPGVGKTRTAAELARRAAADGAIVLYGRCDEDLGVPFQPFVEALDHYSARHPSPMLGRLPGELVRLCPEINERVHGLSAAAVSDPQTEEYRLFEAVTSWLVEASQPSGLVLVLDDVHWATKATLLLLLHVLRGVAAEGRPRLLFVATYRDTELDRAHPLTSVLADLRRLPGVERVDLGGLSLEETVALVENAAGHELDDAARRLAEATFAETEGNPFFVGEVLRHFVETGQVRLVDGRWEVVDPDHVLVPEGVRDVVGRRLGRLSDDANRVLSVASVIGRDFDLELLGWVVDLDEDAVLDALDEASRARMVEEVAPDRFRFFHAMVRETLYGELSPARRRRLHQRVIDVLEKLRPHDVVALAHHALEAGPAGGDMSRAMTFLFEAATQSAAARDLSGAQAYYRQLLELIDESDEPEPRLRVRALYGLGEVQRDQSDPAFRETLLEAVRAALELDAVDLAVRAAVANFRGSSSNVSAVDRERVDALRATLHAVERGGDGGGAAAEALLKATLATEVVYDPGVPAAERLALADGAVAMARSVGDSRLLAEVICRVYQAVLVPERWGTAAALTAEVVTLADDSEDPTLRALARVVGVAGLLGVGDVDGARRLVVEALEIADRDCPPFVSVVARLNAVQYLAYDGHLEEAEAQLQAAHEEGQRVGMVDVEQWVLALLAALQGARGRMGDLADVAGSFAETYPDSASWHCAHVRALVEAHRIDEARAVIERFALDRPETLSNDLFLINAWAQLALAVVSLADADLGASLERVLSPYQDFWVHYYIYVIGPVTWPLAAAVAVQGRYDEALALFEQAEAALNERGMELNVLHLRRDLAVAMSASPREEHRQRARAVAETGARQAEAWGFDRIREQFLAVAHLA